MSDVISEEEKRRLSELEVKQALGGVDKKEEPELFDLRKRKKLQDEINKNRVK